MIKIAPSILAADFARLGDEVARIADHVDLLHIDVMDGHFVPNLSLGYPVIKSLRATTDLYFDCHLMTANPDAYLDELVEAGGNLFSAHLEVFPDPRSVASKVTEAGLEFGLVINPQTPFAGLAPFVELCHQIVIMSVEPGFGGQSFMPEVLGKVELARKWVDDHGLTTDIQIDGGITPETAPSAHAAGANVFVAGSAIFRRDDPVAAIAALREAVGEHGD